MPSPNPPVMSRNDPNYWLAEGLANSLEQASKSEDDKRLVPVCVGALVCSMSNPAKQCTANNPSGGTEPSNVKGPFMSSPGGTANCKCTKWGWKLL